MGLLQKKKPSFKMLGFSFSSELDWGSYINSVKIVSKRKGALNLSMRFFLPEVVLYLYKSTKWPCMYCCYVWAGAPSCYLNLLHKLQRYVFRAVAPSLTASLEAMGHC